jgi:hypothetical protein
MMILCTVAATLLLAGPPALKVKGNQVVTDSGKPVLLRGVNTAAMEWSNDGEGHILKSVEVAVEGWKSNIIRLPLSQDRWFGMAEGQTDKGTAYRALVQKIVDYCSSKQAYVMLDLHWNNAGEWGKNIGQHVMPDMHSVTFWKDCARTYRNHPAVIFDLYNEPHDTTWDIWLKGGEIEEKQGVGARQGEFKPVKYKTPGMQALLDTVRATGANNVIVAGGLDWSYDLSGFMKGYALKDPKGRGVIYACHAYPFKGDTVEKWLTKLDAALPHFPVIVSEFGAQPGRNEDQAKSKEWVDAVVDAMEKRRCHWNAWDFHPAAGPTLISGWDYKPTPWFGEKVKSALLR